MANQEWDFFAFRIDETTSSEQKESLNLAKKNVVHWSQEPKKEEDLCNLDDSPETPATRRLAGDSESETAKCQILSHSTSLHSLHSYPRPNLSLYLGGL